MASDQSLPPELEAYQCTCEDYESAVSPGAYLADLLDYVANNVTDGTGEEYKTPEKVTEEFHRPFGDLPATTEAATEEVRHVRICVEVLMHYLVYDVDGFYLDDSEGYREYVRTAYHTLLEEHGVTHEDVRRARHESDEREFVAEALGIAPEKVQRLYRDTDAGPDAEHGLTEADLEDLFGYRALTEREDDQHGDGTDQTYVEDPFRTLVEPRLREWQLEHLHEEWGQEDYPEDPYPVGLRDGADGSLPAGASVPIVDPDLVGPDDFRRPIRDGGLDADAHRGTHPDGTAMDLWKRRREWVDGQLESLWSTAGPLVAPDAGSDERVEAVAKLLNGALAEVSYDATGGSESHGPAWYPDASASKLPTSGAPTGALGDGDGKSGVTDVDPSEFGSLPSPTVYEDLLLLYDQLTGDAALAERARAAREAVGFATDLPDVDADADPGEAAAAAVEAQLRLSRSSFVRLVELLSGFYGDDTVKEAGWWEVVSILVQARKRTVFEAWAGEERHLDVRFDRKAFWRSQREPKSGEWSFRLGSHPQPSSSSKGTVEKAKAAGKRAKEAVTGGGPDRSAMALAAKYEEADRAPFAAALATAYDVESPWLWRPDRGWGQYLRAVAEGRRHPLNSGDGRASALSAPVGLRLGEEDLKGVLRAWKRADGRQPPPVEEVTDAVAAVAEAADRSGSRLQWGGSSPSVDELETVYGRARMNADDRNPMASVLAEAYGVDTPWAWRHDRGWGPYLRRVAADVNASNAAGKRSLQRLSLSAGGLEAVLKAQRRVANSEQPPESDALETAFEVLAAAWRRRAEDTETDGGTAANAGGSATTPGGGSGTAGTGSGSSEPFVDPERYDPSDLPEEPFGTAPRELYERRQRQLTSKRNHLTGQFGDYWRAHQDRFGDLRGKYRSELSAIEGQLSGSGGVPDGLAERSPLDPVLDDVYSDRTWETYLAEVRAALDDADGAEHDPSWGRTQLDGLELTEAEFDELRRLRGRAKPTTPEELTEEDFRRVFELLPTGTNPVDRLLTEAYRPAYNQHQGEGTILDRVYGGGDPDWSPLFGPVATAVTESDDGSVPPELETLHLSPEAFRTVLGLRTRSRPSVDGERPPESAVAGVVGVLTTAWKELSAYPEWVTTERDRGIVHYWQAYKARLPTHRASRDDRRRWQRTLMARSGPPTVDPDLLDGVDEFQEPGYERPAFPLWRARKNFLFGDHSAVTGPAESLRSTLESGGSVDPANARSKLDEVLSSVVGVDLETLERLGERVAAGEDVAGRLAQLDLTGPALSYLTGIADRLGTTPTTESEWSNVEHLLLQVWKQRQYGRWRREERAAGVVLEPAQFDLPDPDEAFEVPDEEDPYHWRVDGGVRDDWEDALETRVETVEGVDETIEDAVAAAEQEAMADLREHLLGEATAEVDADVEWLSERLLIDFEMYPGYETTRVSQAITSLQTLLTDLNRGVDESHGLYGTTVYWDVEDDGFDTRWKWLGTYPKWKSAMGVYLYPENVLTASLRRHRTPALERLDAKLRGRNLTVSGALAAVEEYSNYYQDVVSLSPVAACMAPYDDDTDRGETSTLDGKDVIYAFARGSETDGLYVRASMPGTERNQARPVDCWREVTVEGKVDVEEAEVVGATCYRKTIYLFFREETSDGTTLGYTTHDTDGEGWSKFEKIKPPEKAKGVGQATVVRTEGRDTPPELLVQYVNWKHSDRDSAQCNFHFYNVRFDEKGNPPEKGEYRKGEDAFPWMSDVEPEGLVGACRMKDLGTDSYSVDGLYVFQWDNFHDETVCYWLKPEGGKYSMDNYKEFDFDAGGETTFVARHDADEVLLRSADDSVKYVFGVTPDPDGPESTTKGNSDGKYRTAKQADGPSHRVEPFDDPDPPIDGVQVNNLGDRWAGPFGVKGEDPEGMYTMSLSQVVLSGGTTRLGGVPQQDPSNPGDVAGCVRCVLVGEKLATFSPGTLAPVGINDHLRNDAWGMGIDPESGEVPDTGEVYNSRWGESLFQANYDYNRLYGREAHFDVPLMVGRRLTHSGHHEAALAWFRLVYDHVEREKQWYELRRESPGAVDAELDPSADWLLDPINPHSIAEGRGDPYTKFTLFSIVQCLLDYGDEEFTRDTPQSVATARSQYEKAIDLLEAEVIDIGHEDPCEGVVDTLQKSIDDDLLGTEYDPGLYADKPELSREQARMMGEEMVASIRGIDDYPDRLKATREVLSALSDGKVYEALEAANDWEERRRDAMPYEERMSTGQLVQTEAFKGLLARKGVARKVTKFGSVVDTVMPVDVVGADKLRPGLRGLPGRASRVGTGPGFGSGTGTVDVGEGVGGDPTGDGVVDPTGDGVTDPGAVGGGTPKDGVDPVGGGAVDPAGGDGTWSVDGSGTDGVAGGPRWTTAGKTASKDNIDYSAFVGDVDPAVSAVESGGQVTDDGGPTPDGGSVAESVSSASMDVLEATAHQFCVPENPLLGALRRHAELNLEKIRSGRNIAGMKRELGPYAASVSVESAVPTAGPGGGMSAGGGRVSQPTDYRYETLLKRAKELAQRAKQIEGDYFRALKGIARQQFKVKQARQKVELSSERVQLQDVRLSRAKKKVEIARMKRKRARIKRSTYRNWYNNPLVGKERKAMNHLRAAMVLQYVAAGLHAAAGALNSVKFFSKGKVAAGMGAITSGLAAAASATAGGLSTQAQIFQIQARKQRRKRRYKLKKRLANQSYKIASKRIGVAKDGVEVVKQEKEIAKLKTEHARDVVEFHENKFTNVELYQWMSDVLERVYRYFLQQSVSVARLAERQLAFRRQGLPRSFIEDDYWNADTGSGVGGGDDEEEDRRGMTGSARLLRDITELDQHEFRTAEDKLEVEKTFSLAEMDPLALQQFRETGVLPFSTTLEDFDRDHPGQYHRLIKNVDVTVVALTPPTEGIDATLRNGGQSRIVVEDTVFREQTVSRDPETVVLDRASTEKERQVNMRPRDKERLKPFENSGVATDWELRMPKAANDMDYDTIADVEVTIEYTALESYSYRKQVQDRLDDQRAVQRGYRFTDDFADAWYDLVNADGDGSTTVGFETDREDFPETLSDVEVDEVTLYLVGPQGNDREDLKDLELTLDRVGGGEKTGRATNGVVDVSSAFAGESPDQEWELTATPKDMPDPFADGTVEDVLMVVSVEGEAPPWPR